MSGGRAGASPRLPWWRWPPSPWPGAPATAGTAPGGPAHRRCPGSGSAAAPSPTRRRSHYGDRVRVKGARAGWPHLLPQQWDLWAPTAVRALPSGSGHGTRDGETRLWGLPTSRPSTPESPPSRRGPEPRRTPQTPGVTGNKAQHSLRPGTPSDGGGAGAFGTPHGGQGGSRHPPAPTQPPALATLSKSLHADEEQHSSV